MTNSQLQLLALVKLAIHTHDEIEDVLSNCAIDWNEVFEESIKQSMAGIAFAGLKNMNASMTVSVKSVDRQLLTKWFGVVEKNKQDNLLLNKRTSQVCQNFNKDGFRVSVMKGQGNALLYGKELSLLRSSGDIDVWVEGGFKKVYAYVQKVSPTRTINEQEIDFNVFSDAVVEVHYRPFIMRHPIRMKRLQLFIKSQSEKCFNNHVKLQLINNEGEEDWVDGIITTVHFNLVQQMAHIHRHLFTEGVGLRQVMDYYFQLVHAEKTLNQKEKEEVVEIVKAVKLEKLAKALMWILFEYFGLEKKCMLWEVNKEDGEYLLDEIMKTGNFGKMDNRHPDGYKTGGLQSFFYTQKRNLRMFRFDRMDWFWGSLWRIYHFAWRKAKGFRH